MNILAYVEKFGVAPQKSREFFSLLKNDEIITNAQIQTYFNLDFPTASMILRKMIRYGFVKNIDYTHNVCSLSNLVYYCYDNLVTRKVMILDMYDVVNLKKINKKELYSVYGPYPLVYGVLCNITNIRKQEIF